MPADINTFFLPNYGDRSVSFVSGSGCYLTDEAGKEYLDFSGGIAVNHLGHCHPALVEALRLQAGRLWHVSNWWLNEPVCRLAQALTEKTFAAGVFLCNSGLEANEAALKLARKYGKEAGGAGKHKIVCFEGGFHGRSLFTAAVSSKPSHREPFAPLPAGIVRCPYNDIASLRAAMNEEICAVILEPVQGERGVYPADVPFMRAVRELCTQHHSLLILDEVQSGMGRTGELFAYMHYGITPDLMTCAKALGGGFPIGALLVGDKYTDVLSAGSHGSTFGGNPLAAAVAYEALRLTDNPSLMKDIKEKSIFLKKTLSDINQKGDVFDDVRAAGLLLGASLKKAYPGKLVMEKCREAGLLVLLAGDGDVLRLAPPLLIGSADLQKGADILKSVFASSARAAK